ncbi:MAG: hypothetical protein ACR2OR_03965 [Hyphomicrobiales bacterium]
MIKKLTVTLAFICLIFGIQATNSDARSPYATWVRHGDTYLVTGKLGDEKQTFRVTIVRKGKRYIVRTPLGDYALAPQGTAVTFKVRIQKDWAKIIWQKQKATIRYKNKTGSASLRRQGR